MLTGVCLRFIQDKSYPKSSFKWEDGAPAPCSAPLYPILQAPSYPTSKHIYSWLQKTKFSEQDLGADHVEMLLDVLMFDSEVERLPAYDAGMWDMGALDVDGEDERREKKRKRKAEEQEWKAKKRSEKEETGEEGSSEEVRKRKKRKVNVKDESEDSKDGKRVKKGKEWKRSDTDEKSDAVTEGSDDNHRKSKKRKKPSSSTKSKTRSRRHSSSPSDSVSETSDLSSGSWTRKKKKSSMKSISKSVFAMVSEPEDSGGMVDLGCFGSANVYREVRQKRVTLGWSQAPYGRYPVFDFCTESGPVNPKERHYHGDRVQQGIAYF